MVSGHRFAIHLPRQEHVRGWVQCGLQWDRLLIRIARCTEVNMPVTVRVIRTRGAGFVDIVSGCHQDITKTHTREVGSANCTNAPCQAGSLAVCCVIHLASTIAGTLRRCQTSKHCIEACLRSIVNATLQLRLTCKVTVTVCCWNFCFRSSSEYDISSPSDNSM